MGVGLLWTTKKSYTCGYIIKPKWKKCRITTCTRDKRHTYIYIYKIYFTYQFLPGWKIERLPSVCPNTTFPFFFGCHLNRLISDRKLCASLCTVTPLSGPEIVQMYNGPLWDTNATASPAFQHQLSDAGIPETYR